MNQIISVRSAALTYQARNGEVEALRSVSFDMAEGEFVSIVGPSGCGKSTLLGALAGLETLDGGTVELYGRPASGADGRMGFMPQRDQLSGGMRQRCALIRTLATQPDILLLDEPFSALDYQTRLAVSGDIWHIIRSEGKTALLVTHDISEAVSMSDRVVVLSRRPATVKAVFDMRELRRMDPLKRRENPVFARYFDAIWKELELRE